MFAELFGAGDVDIFFGGLELVEQFALKVGVVLFAERRNVLHPKKLIKIPISAFHSRIIIHYFV